MSQCAVIACFSKQQKQMQNATLHIKGCGSVLFCDQLSKLQVQKVIAI